MDNWLSIIKTEQQISLHLSAILRLIQNSQGITLSKKLESNLTDLSALLDTAFLEIADVMLSKFSVLDLSELNYERNQINKLLYPEISYLVQTTYQSFHALADFSVSKLTVSEQLSLPNLSEALNNLDSRIEEFDRIKNKNDYNLKEIIEASAFLDGLRAIANELLTVN